MTPATSTAARRAPARHARPAAAPPPLRVVPARGQGRPRRRLVTLLPVAVIVAALLVVVVGQAMLASGQVKMAGIAEQLSAAQAVHRSTELQVAALETPSRIVSAAKARGLVHPSAVTQLPYVSLTTPLPTPEVTAPPATTTATTTPSTTSTTTPSTTAGQ